MLTIKRLGTGQPLVVFSGWSWPVAIFENFFEKIKHEFCFYLVDLPGIGKNRTLLCPDRLETLIELLQKDLPHHADYLGWSLGGLIASAFAFHFPKRVKRLMTLTSSPCYLEKKDWPGIGEKIFLDFQEALDTNGREILKRFLLLQLYKPHFIQAHAKQLEKQWLSVNQLPSIETLHASLKILWTSDIRYMLTTISCEQCHVYGEFDQIVPLATAEAIKRLNSKIRTITIPGATHIPFLTHPQAVLQSIRGFLHVRHD